MRASFLLSQRFFHNIIQNFSEILIYALQICYNIVDPIKMRCAI